MAQDEQKRMNETRAAAKSAREEADKSESALQDEIDQALADGLITEEEQKEINAKRAILDKAKRAQEQATNASRQAEEKAKAALEKAEAETQQLIRKAQAEAGNSACVKSQSLHWHCQRKNCNYCFRVGRAK
jgi:hypothetical protein